MEQFLYVSTAQSGITARELGDILDASRRNNARHALTGVLLFDGASFIQLLEGPAGGLDAVISRLIVDPRHRNMLTVLRGPIQTRAMPDWSMGWIDTGPSRTRADQALPDIQERIGGMSQGDARVLLLSFLNSAAAVAAAAGGRRAPRLNP